MEKRKYNKFLLFIFGELVLGALITWLMVLYQKDPSFVGVMDGTVIAGIMIFALGWMFYVYNAGIFDLVIFGTRQFGAALRGKTTSKKIEDYIYNKEKTQAFIHRSLMISGGIYILIGAILYLIYYTNLAT